MTASQNPVDPADSPFVVRTSLGGEGLRVAIKDNIDIEGLATTAGSRAFLSRPPAAQNATAVQRLLEAGCRIVGKTKLHELAFGVTGINDAFGTPANPRFPDLVPGGSSSGSAAAVAAGLADIAIGTDTGGSIRIPAACCGVFGLKPTFGRLPRDGVTPRLSSLDCLGVFAKSVSGIETAMQILDGQYQRRDYVRCRIGIVASQGHTAIAAAVGTVLASMDADLQPVALRHWDSAFSAGLTLIGMETVDAFRDLLDSPLVAEDVLSRLRGAARMSSSDRLAAEAVRRSFQEELGMAFERVDVLAMPTIAEFPPTLDEARLDRSAVALTRNVRPFNLSGNPAIAIPLAPVDGKPVSLQIVGRMGEDERVCAVARHVEMCIARQ